MKIGFGYDLHRLTEGRALMLGGVHIPHHSGELGHSDGDVLIHALADALLGAAGAGDIGVHFPPEDPAWKDAPGLKLLGITAGILQDRGYRCVQADMTVILEKPKLRPHIGEIRRTLAEVLPGLSVEDISVKAKTKEGCGEVGEGRAIEAYAVVLVEKQ